MWAAAETAEVAQLPLSVRALATKFQVPEPISLRRLIKEMAPDNAEVLGGLARALIAAGERDEARALVDGLSDELKKKPEIARLGSA